MKSPEKSLQNQLDIEKQVERIEEVAEVVGSVATSIFLDNDRTTTDMASALDMISFNLKRIARELDYLAKSNAPLF